MLDLFFVLDCIVRRSSDSNYFTKKDCQNDPFDLTELLYRRKLNLLISLLHTLVIAGLFFFSSSPGECADDLSSALQ